MTQEVEKVEKHGLKFPSRSNDLTTAQKEVLHLITDEFLTIKQIAQRRQSSIQAVYKITAQIKKKGLLDIGLNRVEKVESTFNPSDLRLHAQEFNIRLLWQDSKYQELLTKSNTLFLDSNTIRLYKNAIEVYSGQSFYGKSTGEAEKRSLEYWNRFLVRLEHELKVSLIKPRSRNIRIVNQHWARGNSEVADNATKNRERIWIHAEEDGKLCFITDDSFGFREDETVHPITAKIDRKAIDKQINDWRQNNPPTSSELATHLQTLISVQEYYGKNMVSHVKAIQDLSKGVNKLVKLTQSIQHENWKLKNKHQKTLGDFI